MSYTEIVGFNKQGDAFFLGETKNAFRGAMAIWDIMEKKYLDPLPKPIWMDQDRYEEGGYSRTCDMMNPNSIKEIWALSN